MKKVFGVLSHIVYNEYGYPCFVPVVTTTGLESSATLRGATDIWEDRGLLVGDCYGTPCLHLSIDKKRRDIPNPKSSFVCWEDGETLTDWQRWYDYVRNDRISRAFEYQCYDRREFMKAIKAGLPAKLVIRRQASVCAFTALPLYEVGLQPEADYTNGVGYVRVFQPGGGVNFMRYEDAVETGHNTDRLVTPSLPDKYKDKLLKTPVPLTTPVSFGSSKLNTLIPSS